MNPSPTPRRAAVVRYGTPDIEVLQPGDHVVCAVSGKLISLDLLTYWSVELQEAYAKAEFMTQRWVETHGRTGLD